MTQAEMSWPRMQQGPLVRFWIRLSDGLLALERLAIMGLMGLLVLLVLLNVTTRYMGRSIYWVDESAVYSVVWLTFIGASAMTRLRLDFAVTMLTERLPPLWQRRARIIATCGVIAFALALVAMCWLWLDPVGMARAGFDAREFAGQTFNFIYTERTQTLNWPTWILYLIMPLFAVSMVIHGIANLLEDLGRAPKAVMPGFSAGDVDGVN
ncbi:MAG: TRAP transporter small permease [Beijerinckiaceae bacterium]|nr:TRAP transporter small permease [Beijerinckiaceae bacterium]MCZ8299247.1 TRAP transporter small permease [Beijerinckiaceae bacterium]